MPPVQEPLSGAGKHEKQLQGLALIDRTIERLKQEADDQDKLNNAEEARRIRVRIERLQGVREKRAGELSEGTDAAADGDTVQDHDP